jgi:hypothetical protein
MFNETISVRHLQEKMIVIGTPEELEESAWGMIGAWKNHSTDTNPDFLRVKWSPNLPSRLKYYFYRRTS